MFDPAADADAVHVAADDDAHPDAALFADLDVADDLGAVVDEGGGMDAGKPPRYGRSIRWNYSGQVGQVGRVGGSGRIGRPDLCPARPACPACPQFASSPSSRRSSSGSGRRVNVSRWSRIARICASASPPSCGIGRLRIVRPERRHARARQDVRRLLQPVENPVRLQPLGRHPQVGRQVRRSADPSGIAPSTWHCWHFSSSNSCLPAASVVRDAARSRASGTARSCSRSRRSSG